MDAIIISPYYQQDNGMWSFLAASVVPLFPPAFYRDYTGREIPVDASKYLVIEAINIGGAELAALKADSRFFVLSPGPGNTGNALTTWLSGKGVTGHGVTNSDTAEEATAKLRDWCRRMS